MLALPTKGFATSVKAHNVELGSLVEWLEGCVTFVDSVISQADIVDILLEEAIYLVADFAKEHLDNALVEINRRIVCLGNVCPYRIQGNRITRVAAWEDSPAYSFCLMLALQVGYRDVFRQRFGFDYSQQGALFEQLTIESLEKMGWKTHAAGWSKAATTSIRDKVESLAAHLGEPSRSNDTIALWTEDYAKDGGLDVVCHVAFADKWSGRPLYYVQCASGENWKEKRATPVLALWDKLLDLTTRPTRGISIPFALLQDEFRRAANFDDLSVFLDRHRLCAPIESVPANWLSPGLGQSLNDWTSARIAVLPTVNE